MSNEKKDRLVEFSNEISKSYIDYSVSALKRTIPDIRDGLKPVQRRILFSMFDCGYNNDKPFKKCARIVGDVMGRFHPHGDSSIYKALVRMAQNFSINIPLIEGQGNFGSIDGDEAGAQRYTEAKLSKFSDEMLSDLSEKTVNFDKNYDASLLEPEVLTFKVPNILLNGTIGIAVGYATNVPQHNLSEIVDALCLLLDNENASLEDLMEYIKGPDFPTGGFICSKNIKSLYEEGKGSITFFSKIESFPDDNEIIISALPYGANKLNIISEISENSKLDKIQGIEDVIDDTFKDKIRIIVKTKNGFDHSVIINQINKYTSTMENQSFSFLLMYGQNPHLFKLKDILINFIDFRRSVLQKKFYHELDIAIKKAIKLFGILCVIKNENVNDVINKIMESEGKNDAIKKISDFSYDITDIREYFDIIYYNQYNSDNNIKNTYHLSYDQAFNFIDMKISSLTQIEKKYIFSDLDNLCYRILELRNLTNNVKEIDLYIKNELIQIKNKFGIPRKTELFLENEFSNIKDEDLLHVKKKVVVIYETGILKIFDKEIFKVQNKGGQGKNVYSCDGIKIFKVKQCENKDIIFFFSSNGCVYSSNVSNLEGESGKSIFSIFKLKDDETITEMLVPCGNEEFWFFITENGFVKKHNCKDFDNVRASGKKCISLDEGDSLKHVIPCNNDDVILLQTKNFMILMLKTSCIRTFKTRDTSGVRGIKLNTGDSISNVLVCKNDSKNIVLTISKFGIGKAMPLEIFGESKNRNTKGLICTRKGKISSIGTLAASIIVNLESDKDKNISILTVGGKCINIKISDFPIINRNTLGNRLIKLSSDDYVTDMYLSDNKEADNDNQESENI